MTTKAKNKAAAVTVTLSTADTKATVKVINAAVESNEAAIHALAALDAKYPTVKAKDIAAALVTAGAKWADATIQQEMGRIRKLKREGLYRDDMTTSDMRAALRGLKAAKKPDTDKGDKSEPVSPTSAISGENSEKLVQKISRTAPDTIANALVEALIASGVGDLEAVLAEARRLVIAAVNAKKQAK